MNEMEGRHPSQSAMWPHLVNDASGFHHAFGTHENKVHFAQNVAHTRVQNQRGGKAQVIQGFFHVMAIK